MGTERLPLDNRAIPQFFIGVFKAFVRGLWELIFCRRNIDMAVLASPFWNNPNMP